MNLRMTFIALLTLALVVGLSVPAFAAEAIRLGANKVAVSAGASQTKDRSSGGVYKERMETYNMSGEIGHFVTNNIELAVRLNSEYGKSRETWREVYPYNGEIPFNGEPGEQVNPAEQMDNGDGFTGEICKETIKDTTRTFSARFVPKWHFNNESNVVPYVGPQVGYGYRKVTAKDSWACTEYWDGEVVDEWGGEWARESDSDHNWGWGAVAGVNMFLARQMSIFVEYGYYQQKYKLFGTTLRQTDHSLNAGFAFWW